MIVPKAPPAPATALHAPIALGMRGPWNVVTIIVSVAGERIAAPTPCSARSAIICDALCANPAPRLASTNTNRPVK